MRLVLQLHTWSESRRSTHSVMAQRRPNESHGETVQGVPCAQRMRTRMHVVRVVCAWCACVVRGVRAWSIHSPYLFHPAWKAPPCLACG